MFNGCSDGYAPVGKLAPRAAKSRKRQKLLDCLEESGSVSYHARFTGAVSIASSRHSQEIHEAFKSNCTGPWITTEEIRVLNVDDLGVSVDVFVPGILKCINDARAGREPVIPACISVRTIPKTDCRVGLRGEKGLFATAPCAQMVLGIYKSVNIAYRDYHTLRVTPEQQFNLMSYCFEPSFIEEMRVGQTDIVWSAHNAMNFTALVNDYRIDPLGDHPSVSHLTPNASFIEVLVTPADSRQAYPYVLLVITKPVSVDEEILIDYSESYWNEAYIRAKQLSEDSISWKTRLRRLI